MTEIIQVGNFVEVLNDNLAEHEVFKGDTLYIAGDAVVNVSEEDPYVLRRILVAAYVNDGHIDIERNAFTIDGLSLKAVDEFTQKRLDQIKLFDFSEKAEDAAPN